jgi:hypothetical protein
MRTMKEQFMILPVKAPGNVPTRSGGGDEKGRFLCFFAGS